MKRPSAVEKDAAVRGEAGLATAGTSVWLEPRDRDGWGSTAVEARNREAGSDQIA